MSLVLVVDDAAFQRMRVRRSLEGAGHSVVEASSGHEAVDLYEQQRPDAVLLDITMPGMSGVEALRRIRANHPDARVVMLSAMAQQAIVMEAMRAGARDFVVKPAEASRVLAAVARAVRA
jgi:two-component system chemotaxis response regulator CheY